MKFQSYRTEGQERHFGAAPMFPEDERLHPIPPDAHYNWSETNMFGFAIPEHAIDCMIWYIYWPKLGSTYGGVTVWKGFKTHHLESEVFDFRVAMPLPEDNTSWACPNGITIKMVEALKVFDINYRAADGETRFDLTLTAIMPPAMRYNGNHITQAMRARGKLVLAGKEYEIDSYYSRDRSWREHRNEAPFSAPPVSWIAGVFGDDFAFHLTAFESGNRRPEWLGAYPEVMAPGGNVLWGYVWDSGQLLGVETVDMVIDRTDELVPMGATISIRAENGKTYDISGRTIALNPAIGWPNVATNYALTEWRCNGRTGYGDNQDVTSGSHRRLNANLKGI